MKTQKSGAVGKIAVMAFFTLLLFLSMGQVPVKAQETTCTIYFTGIGCPHCAKADPFLIKDMTKKYLDLVIIEYEIYQQQSNAQIMYNYNTNYETGLGIPLIIFGNEYIVGDNPILNGFDGMMADMEGNPCPLVDGSSLDFSALDLNALPGNFKVWRGERVLISSGGVADAVMLRDLVLLDIGTILDTFDYRITDPVSVALSGENVKFENAVNVNGWKLQWNGDPSPGSNGNGAGENKTENQTGNQTENQGGDQWSNHDENLEELNIAKIMSLAAVDAVNPCAIAVLTLMLIAIITYNPKKRRNVLLAGMAFTFSIYVLYLFYGLVIIKFFQLVQALTSVRLMLYVILGVVAMILGIMNIKDFFSYSPGGAFTEMPMFMRPKVKGIINGITTPKGAFVVGAFVTIFLLPCTIGPYVIAGGILSMVEIMETIPWLLLYNLIFILPMVAITLAVYVGFTTVENVSGWKDRNIRYLHLIAGTVMLLLGIAMVMGWV